jgi:hypothetical protein
MRSAALCSLATAAVLALAACGGDALALDPVAKAATKTSTMPSFRFDLTASIGVMGHAFTMTADGVADTTHDAASMSFHFAGAGVAPSMAGQSADAMIVGHTVYMHMQAFAPLLKGKQWLKLDLDKAARAKGVTLPSSSLGTMSPQDMLHELLAAGTSHEVGTETVDGVRTTHYHVDIEPKNLPNVPAKERAAVQKLFGGFGTTTIPADVWVDGQGLLRREQVAMNVGSGKTSLLRMTVTLDLHDFGVAAAIVAPAASDVVDATSLATR